MVGYILIDPHKIHSYRELEEDHELMEALDNYYSMQCFAAENRFIDISTNEEVASDKIFENASSWYATYMLTDETRNGKWIGFIQFYNPDLKNVANYYDDLIAFKTLLHFFEDESLSQLRQHSILKRAIYIAMNIVTGKYENMPQDMSNEELESLKEDFKNFYQNSNSAIKFLEVRRQFWLQMEAILENSPELKEYFAKELQKAYEQGDYKKEMYVKTYLDDRYLEPRVSHEELIDNIRRCEEEYLNSLGPNWTILDGNELDKKADGINKLMKVS